MFEVVINQLIVVPFGGKHNEICINIVDLVIQSQVQYQILTSQNLLIKFQVGRLQNYSLTLYSTVFFRCLFKIQKIFEPCF